MKKILSLTLAAALLLAACRVKPQEERPEPPQPLQLNADERVFWQQMAVAELRKGGANNPERLALYLDKMILELRKRGAEK